MDEVVCLKAGFAYMARLQVKGRGPGDTRGIHAKNAVSVAVMLVARYLGYDLRPARERIACLPSKRAAWLFVCF